MNKRENRRTLGQHLLFAGLVLFISVLCTILVLSITLPVYKKQVLLTATEKTAAYSEEKLQKLVGESLPKIDTERYLEEQDVDKIKSDITIEVKKIIGEKESAESKEWKEIKQNYEESFSSLTGDVISTKSELSELAGDVIGTKSQISSLAGDVTNTKSELSELAGSVSSTKSEVSAMQIQMKELQNYIGDCVVRYNPEDGHFYSIYNEGTEEEVAKKLDFAQ